MIGGLVFAALFQQSESLKEELDRIKTELQREANDAKAAVGEARVEVRKAEEQNEQSQALLTNLQKAEVRFATHGGLIGNQLALVQSILKNNREFYEKETTALRKQSEDEMNRLQAKNEKLEAAGLRAQKNQRTILKTQGEIDARMKDIFHTTANLEELERRAQAYANLLSTRHVEYLLFRTDAVQRVTMYHLPEHNAEVGNGERSTDGLTTRDVPATLYIFEFENTKTKKRVDFTVRVLQDQHQTYTDTYPTDDFPNLRAYNDERDGPGIREHCISDTPFQFRVEFIYHHKLAFDFVMLKVTPNRGMHLTPEAPTYSMRAHGGLPAYAGGV